MSIGRIVDGQHQIYVGQDIWAIVDQCDWLWLVPYNWCFNGGYATAQIDGRTRSMHQLVAERHGLRGKVDHKNRLKHDNRFSNLRIATQSQNQANTGLSRRNTSGYKGVRWRQNCQKWEASLRANQKLHGLGHWGTSEEAARAYDKAALEFFGEFASLNFPRSDYV